MHDFSVRIACEREQCQDLERVCRMLLQLVREEYPPDRSLTEIVVTWGDRVSDADLAAVERFERDQVDKNSDSAGFDGAWLAARQREGGHAPSA